MAFIHTNFLTGNDTTGNGSTATPYKTVFKALGVAASNDFIKVAGGQWSAALAGNFTFTLGTNTIDTTVSQVGIVLVDDILSFEDGQFGFDKFHIKVLSVTASVITMALWWMGPTITTSTVKRIETYHYSNSTGTNFEILPASSTFQLPNGRTGITISGGWSNDFTTQGGWTVGRRTGQALSVTTGPIMFDFFNSPGIGTWGEDLIWDKFLNHTSSGIIRTGNTANQSYAVGSLASSRASVLQLNQTHGIGVFQADPLVPSKWYFTNPQSGARNDYINASISTLISQPDTYECDVYGSLSFNIGNNALNALETPAIGMFSRVGQEGSKNQMNVYLRQNVINGSGYDGSSINSNPSWLGRSGIYIKKLNYYMNEPQPVTLVFGAANQTVQIEDIEFFGSGASQSGLNFTYDVTGQIIIDLAAEAKTIDTFKPGVGNSNYLNFLAGATSAEATLNRICQSNLTPTQITDVDGLKTMDIYNNIYFKDNGSLKVSSSTNYWNPVLYAGGPVYVWKLIGVIDKPSTPFTVSFTLKVDAGAEAKWDTLAVQYGPNVQHIVEQALTPTSSFATYTMTVDPADYTDWTKFKFPLYFGIRSRSANTYLSEAMTYAYIQSVTIV